MVLQKLRRNYEERHNHLIEKLKKNRDSLDKSTQHQIYGAIKEIEKFLDSINYYSTLETENNFEIDLSKEKEWPIIERTKKIIYNTGNKTKKIAEYTFIHVPRKISTHIKKKYDNHKKKRELYKKIKTEVQRKLKEENIQK